MKNINDLKKAIRFFNNEYFYRSNHVLEVDNYQATQSFQNSITTIINCCVKNLSIASGLDDFYIKDIKLSITYNHHDKIKAITLGDYNIYEERNSKYYNHPFLFSNIPQIKIDIMKDA